MDTRARNWFLTVNNYSVDERNAAEQYKCDYLLIAEEVGEKEHTEHLHIYFELKNAKTFSKIKKEWPRANIQVAKGNAEQVKEYLSKQNLVIEIGKPKKQGQRNDLENVREVLKETNKMRDVVDIATSYQSVRMAECILKYHEQKRNFKPLVKWFYGSTGTGKSRSAYEECDPEDTHTQDNSIKWWEGYDAHKNVIIDDFRRDFCKFHELLRLLDRYPYRIECKGGSRQFLAEKIIITSAYHPEQIYETREDLGQLIRRIDEIKIFGECINGEENEDNQTEATENVF
jgi:hypothetical protein